MYSDYTKGTMSNIPFTNKKLDSNPVLWEIIYEENVDALYRYGMSMSFSEDRCMDAIHDVFYKFFSQSRKDIERIENVKAYLFRSLRNRLFDMSKKDGKFSDSTDVESIPFAINISVEDEFVEQEDKMIVIDQVNRLMGILTNRQREVIYLRYLQEMDYEEIAVLIDVTPKSVRMLVYRAMEKMRENSIDKNILLLILSLTLF